MFSNISQNSKYYLKMAAAIAAGILVILNLKAVILCAVLIGGVYYVVKAYQNCDAAYAQR